MATMTEVRRADRAAVRRVAVASAIGITIEWYDYFNYSTAAALVFGPQFFSSLSPSSGTLAAFATLGVGFVARPLGGILWGHFGGRLDQVVLAVVVLNVGLGAAYGPQPALFTELFDPWYPYSGASIAYSVGAVFGGGFAPLIATALQNRSGTSLTVSVYMLVIGVISLICVALIKETNVVVIEP